MFTWNDGTELCHHGIRGQKWGVRNGPPYPLNKRSLKLGGKKKNNIVEVGIKKQKLWHSLDEIKAIKNPQAPEVEASKVNPNYGKLGYMANCLNCVIAFEMRRRLFDVEANPSGSNKIRLLSKFFESGNVENDIYWADKSNPLYNEALKELCIKTGKLPTDLSDFEKSTAIVKKLLKNCRAGARGFIGGGKSEANGYAAGHVSAFEILPGNIPIIYETQANTVECIYPSVEDFCKRFNNYGVFVIRIDDKPLKVENLHLVVRERDDDD